MVGKCEAIITKNYESAGDAKLTKLLLEKLRSKKPLDKD